MMMHEGLLVPVLIYESETVVWMEKERSRISAIQMDSVSGFLVIIKICKMLDACVRKLCGETNRVIEHFPCDFEFFERENIVIISSYMRIVS